MNSSSILEEIYIVFILSIPAFLIGIAIIWLFKRHHKLQFFKKYGIPGPEPNFFTGNMIHLRQKPTPNDVITEWLKQYGNIFGYYIGDVPFLVVNDLNIIKTAMIKESHNCINRPRMVLDVKPLIYNIISLRDQRWKDVRKALTPAFSTNKIKHMSDIIDKKIDMFIKVLTNKAQKQEMFDIYEIFQALTLDVIGECALAMKVQCLLNSEDPFLIAVRDFFKFANNKALELAVMFPFFAYLLTFINNYMTAGAMTNMIVDNVKSVIDCRRKQQNIQGIDFLQLMLDAGKDTQKVNEEKLIRSKTVLTNNEIIGNAHVFLLAGYETTATALAFTAYLLLKNPDVQEKMYEEVCRVFGDNDHISYEDVQKLQYLDQVFNESLRMYPPVTGFITRECDQNITVNGQIIPKGVVLQAPVWDIHHNPDFWPDPWKFNPERFSPENKSSINPSAFMPFGVGPRSCIGIRFAQLESKLALAHMVKKFVLVPCEKTKDNLDLCCPTVIINPISGIYMQLAPRN